MRLWTMTVPILFALSQAQAHPLAGAIRALAKASSEIKKSKDSSADPTQLRELANQTDSIWAKALLMPLKIEEPHFAELGIEFKTAESSGGVATIKTNANMKSLIQDAHALRPARWQELADLSKKQFAADVEILQMITSNDFAGGISATNLDVYWADARRSEVLRNLSESAQAKVACIADLSSVVSGTGLKPVEVSDGSYMWSPIELNRVYGVSDISQLSESARTKAKTGISSLLEVAAHSVKVCISPEGYQFIFNEAKRL